MSDFLINLARRGAGLATTIGSRPAPAEAAPDALEQHVDKTAAMWPEATAAATPAVSAAAAPHAEFSAPPSANALVPLTPNLSTLPAAVIQRVAIEAPSAAPSARASAVAPADPHGLPLLPTVRAPHDAGTIGPAAPPVPLPREAAPVPRPLVVTVTSDAPPAPRVAERSDIPVRPHHPRLAGPAPVASVAERPRADGVGSSGPPVTRATVRVEREPLPANVPVPVDERSDPALVVMTRVERTLEHASPALIARARPTEPETASRAAPARDAAPPRTPASSVERIVETLQTQVVPARARAHTKSVSATPSRAPAPLESPIERIVHVQIGTVEIQAAPRGESPPPAPASIATSPETSSGFDSFARLRSYAPWQR